MATSITLDSNVEYSLINIAFLLCRSNPYSYTVLEGDTVAMYSDIEKLVDGIQYNYATYFCMKRRTDPFYLADGEGVLRFVTGDKEEVEIKVYHEGLTLEDLSKIYSLAVAVNFADEEDMFCNWPYTDIETLYEEDNKGRYSYLIDEKKKELAELEEKFASL